MGKTIANQPVKRSPVKTVKKDDTVQVIAGKFKGRTGKVLSVSTKAQTVTVEGIGEVTRHVKPSQFNPRGGDKQLHVGLDISKIKKVESAAPATKPAKTVKKETK